MFGTPTVGQGTAASASRRRWQDEIRGIARKAWPPNELPVVGEIRFRLAYFHVYAQAADLDNIVKTAQDALEKIVYMNERQIVDVVASARPKEGEYRIDVTPKLARALLGHTDFVHIVVDLASDFEVYR